MKLLETLKTIDKKTYIYIGAAIAVIVAIVLIARKITKEEKSGSDSLEEIKKYLEKLNGNGGNNASQFTYSDSQYSIYADSIESALSDKGISAGLLGVNQKSVYGVFEKMKTDADVAKLIDAFGTREFRKVYTFKGQKCTLPQALSLLMTTGEIEKINEILKENNISYQF